jgi:hypothetical protein
VIFHQKKRQQCARPSARRCSNKPPLTHILGKVAHEADGLVRAQMKIEEMSEMNKAEIVAELEAIAWNRLFNCHQWLPDRETIWALHQKLIKMGLVEHISSDTWRNTPLGTELDIDLFQVFMGLSLMRGRCRTSSKIITSSMSGRATAFAHAWLGRLIRNLFWRMW